MMDKCRGHTAAGLGLVPGDAPDRRQSGGQYSSASSIKEATTDVTAPAAVVTALERGGHFQQGSKQQPPRKAPRRLCGAETWASETPVRSSRPGPTAPRGHLHEVPSGESGRRRGAHGSGGDPPRWPPAPTPARPSLPYRTRKGRSRGVCQAAGSCLSLFQKTSLAKPTRAKLGTSNPFLRAATIKATVLYSN